MLEKIKNKINQAGVTRNKSAMFHYQVLLHAKELVNIDAVDFCIAVGVPESYATEYRKMIKLSRIMQEEGARLDIV